MNQDLEKLFGDFIFVILKSIGKLFIGLFYGIRKLKWKNNAIVFLIMFIFPSGAILFRNKIFIIDVPLYIRYLIYYFLLCQPIIYLIFIGKLMDKAQEKYKKIFKEIGFSGQDKKHPFFVGTREEGKKIIYVFKSNIPLAVWKKAKEHLETGLDCNILLIQEGKNKKLVELTTVPSSCQIPEKIDWSDEYISQEDGVVTVGEGALGPVKFDLNRTPHVLIAGETGSGKSVILRVLLRQLIKKHCEVYMFDFKGGVEFGKKYEKYGEVITDRKKALSVLAELVTENERRLNLFRDLEVKNLKEYNKKTGENLPRIGVITDEIAEMLDKKGIGKSEKEIFDQLEGMISTLARLSRATGINLFLGVQRPDANILPGQIKNNIPVRISGRFADKAASEIVLGNTMAVDLPDVKGRFLYKVGNETIEFQAYYFDDDTMMDDTAQDRTPQTGPSNRRPILQGAKGPIKKDIVKKSGAADKGNIKKKVAGIKTGDSPEGIDFDEKIEWEPDKKKGVELDLDYSMEDHE